MEFFSSKTMYIPVFACKMGFSVPIQPKNQDLSYKTHTESGVVLEGKKNNNNILMQK